LPVYASGGVNPSIEALTEELKNYVARGFRAVKIRLGYGFEEDLARVAAARKAVGPDVHLLLDMGASYLPEPPNVIEMMRLARHLEQFDPFWLEEPLPPDDLAGHRRLRSSTWIPIAAGENTRTVSEVQQIMDAEAVDILQTDVVYAGGIMEQLRIGEAAASYGVMLAPHTWGSAPGLLANLHTIACLSNALIVEYSQAYNPLRQSLLVRPLQFEDGELLLPEVPGLGVDITSEVIERYPYDPKSAVTLETQATSRYRPRHPR